MEATLAYVLPVVAFVAIYVVLRRRAQRGALDHGGSGQRRSPHDQARWLLLIAGCMAIAVLIGVLA